MTKLMYRGVAHDGLNETREPGPATMIYRGAHHDRIASVRPATRALRQYRGVAYLKGGARIAVSPVMAAGPAAELALR